MSCYFIYSTLIENIAVFHYIIFISIFFFHSWHLKNIYIDQENEINELNNELENRASVRVPCITQLLLKNNYSLHGMV